MARPSHERGHRIETAARVVRSLLYGAPTQAEAELRMQQQDRMTEMLSRQVSSMKWEMP